MNESTAGREQTTTQLLATADRLEGHGQYNLAKLVRAAADSLARQTAKASDQAGRIGGQGWGASRAAGPRHCPGAGRRWPGGPSGRGPARGRRSGWGGGRSAAQVCAW